MQLPDFKIRASAAGKLMTKPRNKKDTISQTTLTYVKEWVIEQLYGIKKDFSSKYTEKGNKVEDEAINKAIEWLDIPFALKNEKYFEDEYFCGTPDLILEDEVLDIKCPFDAFTFPLFETEIPNKDYAAQLQVYMHLTGKKKARLVYVLMNTPQEVDKWGPTYDYTNTPKELRIKTFSLDYDPSVIEHLQNQVTEINKYIETL